MIRRPVRENDNMYFGLARLFSLFFQKDKKQSFVVLILMTLSALADGLSWTIALPLISIVIDGSARASNIGSAVASILQTLDIRPTLLPLLGVIVLCLLAKSAITILASIYIGNITTKLSSGMRLDLLDHLLQVNWNHFTKHPISLFADVIGHGASRAGNTFRAVAKLITDIILTAVYFIFILLISWPVAIAMALIGLSIGILSHSARNTARRFSRAQVGSIVDLGSGINNTLLSIKSIKAMGLARYVERKLLRSSERIDRSAIGVAANERKAEMILSISVTGLLALSFSLAVEVWSVDIAEVLIAGVLTIKSIDQITRVLRQLQVVATTESAQHHTSQLIQQIKNNEEISVGISTPSLDQGIFIDAVSFSYHDKAVLKNVTLQLPAGQLTTITGASGAGKTTIADLILGLHRPRTGTIKIDNRDLMDVDLAQWRKAIGYVPQEVILLNTSIAENVALGDPNLTRAHIETALKRAGAWKFVCRLPEGIDYQVGERGGKLSGGQRQRIALARALVHQPSLLIMDEATSALDPETELQICRNVKELTGSLTILAITHQRAWVDIADHVYHLSSPANSLGNVPQT